MSENTAASVLLPTAAVDIFSLGNDLIESAGQLVDDWRFARVTLSVEQSGIDAAIAKYEAHSSPALVIIETDDIGPDFIAKLEKLAGACVADTAAVIVGPTNDVALYRHLVQIGVSDYLVHPVSLEDLIGVVSETLIGRIGVSDSRLIAVLGAKGGVGVSTISQIFARILSENAHLKTALLDACGAWSSNSVAFAVDAATTLREAISTAQNGADESLARLLFKANDHLTLLATGNDALLEACAEADGYEALIDRMMTKYPILITDLSQADITVAHRVLSKAHGIALVTTPLLPALRNTRTLLTEIKQLRGDLDTVRLIVNMTGIAPGVEVPKSEIEAVLEHDLAIDIAFDPKTFIAAEADASTLSAQKGGAAIVNTLASLASDLAGHKESIAQETEAVSFINRILPLGGKKKDEGQN